MNDAFVMSDNLYFDDLLNVFAGLTILQANRQRVNAYVKNSLDKAKKLPSTAFKSLLCKGVVAPNARNLAPYRRSYFVVNFLFKRCSDIGSQGGRLPHTHVLIVATFLATSQKKSFSLKTLVC